LPPPMASTASQSSADTCAAALSMAEIFGSPFTDILVSDAPSDRNADNIGFDHGDESKAVAPVTRAIRRPNGRVNSTHRDAQPAPKIIRVACWKFHEGIAGLFTPTVLGKSNRSVRRCAYPP